MNKNKVKILNNAIDTSKFSYNLEIRNKIREHEKLEDKFVVGHVGRFVNQKNHSFLLKIFYEIHKADENSVLMLLGDGPLRESIKEEARDLGLENSVRFLGIKENVNEYMQAMDVFLLPSFYEGLPVVGVEAQTAGLRCIFSTNVTKEAKLTDNVEYLDLDDGEKVWAEVALKSKNFDRKNTASIIIKKGFDIKYEAKKLEDYYLGLVKDKKLEN